LTPPNNHSAQSEEITILLHPIPYLLTLTAKTCGMLTDKFGTPWIVNRELQADFGQ